MTGAPLETDPEVRPGEEVLAFSGEVVADASLDELIGSDEGREFWGNIEVRRLKGISWFLVRENGGLGMATHRALDLWMKEAAGTDVRVLWKVPEVEVPENGVPRWRCVVRFCPILRQKAPRS